MRKFLLLGILSLFLISCGEVKESKTTKDSTDMVKDTTIIVDTVEISE